METQITTIRIEGSLLGKLDEWANRNQRSRNWCINQAIYMFLEEDEKLTFELQKKAGKR